MKKVSNKIWMLLFCSVILMGCAISINTTDHKNQPWVANPFDMSRNDYTYIKDVKCEFSATYVLGIGGWKSKQKNAVEELCAQADLNLHQRVVNITHKTRVNVIVCGLVVKRVTSATGQLIQLGNVTTPPTQSTSLSKQSTNTIDEPLDENAFIDLGLPSGTKWKAVNESGRYTYDEAMEKFGNQLPTEEQCKELLSTCEWNWTDKGYKVIGPNNKYIFLAANGFQDCTKHEMNVGYTGSCWSSSGAKGMAKSLFYHPVNKYITRDFHCVGLSVHLVE